MDAGLPEVTYIVLFELFMPTVARPQLEVKFSNLAPGEKRPNSVKILLSDLKTPKSPIQILQTCWNNLTYHNLTYQSSFETSHNLGPQIR